MRFFKTFVGSCALALLVATVCHPCAAKNAKSADRAIHSNPANTQAGLLLVADGGEPLPRPPLVTDGGEPLPRPPLFADGGEPLPRPPLLADGGEPLPRPPLVADGGEPLPRPNPPTA